MKKFFITLIIFMLGTSAIFAQKKGLQVKTIKADPNPVKIGYNVKLTVEFTGKQNKLKSVELFSREYGYDAPKMVLVPGPDKKQNIWTYEFQVPYEVPAGTYNMELKALDKKGTQIISESCSQCVYGKSAEIRITVVN